MRLRVKEVTGFLTLPEPTNVVACTACGALFSTQIQQRYLRVIATVFADYHVHQVEVPLLIVCPCCNAHSIMRFEIEGDKIGEPTEGIDDRFHTMPVGSQYLS